MAAGTAKPMVPSPRVEPGARVFVRDELSGPHLMLTHAGDIDGLGSGDLAQLRDHVFGAQAAVMLRRIAQRIGRADSGKVFPPSVEIVRIYTGAADGPDQLGDGRFDVTDDRNIRMAVLPISAGSMSTWMTFASGAKESSLPVTRSSNRAPSATSRSLFCNAATAATVPCIPGMPRFCGWLSGNAASHQRRHYRDTRQLGQIEQFGRRITADDATADIEHGLARRRDQFGGFLDLTAVRLRVGLITGQVQLRRPGELALALQDVLGMSTSTAPDARWRRCGTPGDHSRDLVAIAHQEVVLGDGHRDARDVGFLERVGADEAATDLAGDRNHGNRIHLGICQRCHEVGRAGT